MASAAAAILLSCRPGLRGELALRRRNAKPASPKAIALNAERHTPAGLSRRGNLLPMQRRLGWRINHCCAMSAYCGALAPRLSAWRRQLGAVTGETSASLAGGSRPSAK